MTYNLFNMASKVSELTECLKELSGQDSRIITFYLNNAGISSSDLEIISNHLIELRNKIRETDVKTPKKPVSGPKSLQETFVDKLEPRLRSKIYEWKVKGKDQCIIFYLHLRMVLKQK